MSLFSKLPVPLPVPVPNIPVPIVGPLAGALLGNSASTAAAISNPPATNDAKANTPFQIPVANPLTGAVQFIEGTAQEGLKNLDAGAKAVLATAAEIPIVHSDGSVTVVPGGAAGLQSLQDNVAKVIASAPAATKLNPIGDAVGAMNGIVGGVGASLPSTLGTNPFQLPPNPITGAASLVQGTFDAGLKGLTSLSEQTIGNAPSFPIVLPNGQLSIVQGGLDGLNALQNDAHRVLEGAPKLPGVFDMAAGAMGAISGGGGGDALGNALNSLTGGLSGSFFASLESYRAIIERVLSLPPRILAFSQQLSKNARVYYNFITSENIGPAELDAFFANHANSVLKITLLAILVVLGILGIGGAIVFVGLLVVIAATPFFVGLLWLLGFEALVWRHWRNLKAKNAAAASSS